MVDVGVATIIGTLRRAKDVPAVLQHVRIGLRDLTRAKLVGRRADWLSMS